MCTCTLAGVYLSLLGVVLTNDSIVSISDIIASENREDNMDRPESHEDRMGPLVCYTDRRDCCSEPSEGDWYLPDHSSASDSKGFLVSNEYPSTLELTRDSNMPDFMPPSGEYCCWILDANGLNQSACVSVGM